MWKCLGSGLAASWVWLRPPLTLLGPSFEDSAPRHIFRNSRRGALSSSTGAFPAAPVRWCGTPSPSTRRPRLHAVQERGGRTVLPALPPLGLCGAVLARRPHQSMLGLPPAAPSAQVPYRLDETALDIKFKDISNQTNKYSFLKLSCPTSSNGVFLQLLLVL